LPTAAITVEISTGSPNCEDIHVIVLDVEFVGMLSAINTSRAEAEPGVNVVISSENLPD
jgi:hypothetical protein